MKVSIWYLIQVQKSLKQLNNKLSYAKRTGKREAKLPKKN